MDANQEIERAGVRGVWVGDRVKKSKGFRFPGVVCGYAVTKAGKLRVVVEADDPNFDGMLHIYDPDQLEPRKD